MYQKLIKPLLDRFIALFVLCASFPVFIPVTFVLLIANKGSVWFTQPRPGLNGKIFRVIKFKTMSDEKDARGELLSDDQRLTFVGKIVRKTSMDELPQLINVICGDMSIIGPRPLLIEYLELYNDVQRKRHNVKPGITGWAQVNGRNSISWSRKFEYDVWYVEHQSFLVDMKILYLTLIRVLTATGIGGENTLTMKKFSGNA